MAIAMYFRVSTDLQETAAQQHSVRLYCQQRGYQADNMVVFEDEGISGSTMARPGFQSLLEAVEQGLVERVVTFELSRLSRDFMAFLNVMDKFQKRGVVVEVPGQGEQDFGSSTDKLVTAIKAFSANHEREMIAKRIKSGLARVKSEGKKLGAEIGNQRRTGKLKPVDIELKNKVNQLLSAGISIRKAAKILGVSVSKVYRIKD